MENVGSGGICVSYHSRFYVQVGHETTYASSGNKHSLNRVIVRPTKIIKDLCEASTKIIFIYWLYGCPYK